MIYSSLLSKVVAAAYVFQISIAHPGQTMQDLERIAATVAKVRADLGLPKKPQVLLASRISHLSGLNVTPTTPNMEEMIYCNSSCILSLEGETGPFYVSGEHIRSNLRETQAGVPLVIDGQFLDSTACEPIQDLYWDIWNCNSTGIYGGIPASPINDNVGVNHSVTYTASAAARLTANGGAPIAGGGRPPTAQSDKNVSH
ncbi:hypothetical protein ABEW05_006521 [Botrytis cinerea]